MSGDVIVIVGTGDVIVIVGTGDVIVNSDSDDVIVISETGDVIFSLLALSSRFVARASLLLLTRMSGFVTDDVDDDGENSVGKGVLETGSTDVNTEDEDGEDEEAVYCVLAVAGADSLINRLRLAS